MNLLEKAYDKIENAEYLLIGAGAGLSAAAGFRTDEEIVSKLIPEYKLKYGITDLYDGSFYPFETIGESFAYWSKVFHYWRYEIDVFPLYSDLLDLISEKNYFIITTNGDGQFLRANFPRDKLFLIQGDHGDFACSNSCCDEVYDAKSIYESMIKHSVNFTVPDGYIPKCPHCGSILMMRQRSGVKNLEIKPYIEEKNRYEDFLKKALNGKTVLLELGVGFNTPTLIKIPFWNMVNEHDNLEFITINSNEPIVPDEIKNKSISLKYSISDVINTWKELK